MKEIIRVLFVDDEDHILSSIRRAMIDEDFEALFAGSGREALGIMSRMEIAVIVSDMRMPEMDGLTLLKQVKELYPDTVRIVLTGYTQLQQVLATINQADIFRFLTKPWKLEEDFRPSIKQAIEYYKLTQQKERYEAALLLKNQSYQNILKKIDEIINFSRLSADIFGRVSLLMFSSIVDGVSVGDPSAVIAKRALLCNKFMANLVESLNSEPLEKNFEDLVSGYMEWFTSEGSEQVKVIFDNKFKSNPSLGYRWVVMLGLMKYITLNILKESMPKQLIIAGYENIIGDNKIATVSLSFSCGEEEDPACKGVIKKKQDSFLYEIAQEVMICIKGGYLAEETTEKRTERFSLLI